jgi:lipopolysaccharide/colanic/teichoic acid biosynthesis glycosyltransferase
VALVDAVVQGTTHQEMHESRSPWAKRVIDVVVGVPLCVIAVPIILALAVVLAWQFRTNPFFVHDRVGRGGLLVSIPKLRTLPRHTHPYADKTVTELVPPSRFCQVLRSTHLDELPQLFLVPFGRLSLVGPRPRMIGEARDHGDEEYAAVRTSIPQGCTGLWQISTDQVHRVSDHPEYDLFYVAQRTTRLDAWILWRTVWRTLGGAAIQLGDIPPWLLRRPDLVLADLGT